MRARSMGMHVSSDVFIVYYAQILWNWADSRFWGFGMRLKEIFGNAQINEMYTMLLVPYDQREGKPDIQRQCNVSVNVYLGCVS